MTEQKSITTEELLSRYDRGDRHFSNLNLYQVRVGEKNLSGCEFSGSTFR